MKKALVYYLYGNRNAGDMAICAGTIEFLKKCGYEITMVSRFSEAEEEYWKSKDYISEYYPEVKVYPGPFSFERNFSVPKKLLSYGVSMLKVAGLIPDKRLKQLIKEADIVFFNGGNLLRGASMADYLRLFALFYPIKTAYSMKKPVYCLPQSTAKTSSLGKKILAKYLACFKTVYVREEISFKELKKFFPQIPFELATDMAFFCEDNAIAVNKYSGLQLPDAGKTIAVVVRNTGIGDIGELSTEKQDKLVKILLSFVEIHRDYSYLIAIQTEKDRAFSEKLNSLINNIVPTRMIENHDPLVLREIYRHTAVLLTMRLHAGILALSAQTPVIGLFSEEWGLKNPGIMRDYDMPFVIVENVEDKVLSMPTDAQRANIIKNRERYLETLNAVFESKN